MFSLLYEKILSRIVKKYNAEVVGRDEPKVDKESRDKAGEKEHENKELGNGCEGR